MNKAMLATLFLGIMLCMGIASAASPTIEWVKINGDQFDFVNSNEGYVLRVERGDQLDIRIKLSADENVKDVEVAADILGYEYNDFARISDSTALFDLDAGDSETKDLSLILPANADKDNYDLRIRVGGRTGPACEQRIALKLVGARHAITLRDIILSPSGNVEAGRALLATVRMKNSGDSDEEGIKLIVSIPALGVEASDYINELESDESTTSEELYLRIPTCAKPGVYDVLVTAEFDERYERDTMQTSILVTEGELCKAADGAAQPTTPQTVISVGATAQELSAGAGVVYPITITNMGSSSRSYVLSVEGASAFADVSISPSSMLLVNGGETKSAFVFLTAKPGAVEGAKMFSLTVSSGAEVVKQVPLTANVVKGSSVASFPWERVKRGLEIGLVVLVILLVILGLIIGFSKLKGSEEKEGNKSYY